jgi:hypothetical protein
VDRPREWIVCAFGPRPAFRVKKRAFGTRAHHGVFVDGELLCFDLYPRGWQGIRAIVPEARNNRGNRQDSFSFDCELQFVLRAVPNRLGPEVLKAHRIRIEADRVRLGRAKEKLDALERQLEAALVAGERKA